MRLNAEFRGFLTVRSLTIDIRSSRLIETITGNFADGLLSSRFKH